MTWREHGDGNVSPIETLKLIHSELIIDGLGRDWQTFPNDQGPMRLGGDGEEFAVSRAVGGGQGSNSVQIRHFNERVILAALRRLGEASKADLARYAQLTNNAAGQIVRELEQQSLIKTLGKRAGNRGQPATLLTLNSDGAYAIGVTIGRRSIRSLLVDFHGQVLERRAKEQLWPLPQDALAFIVDSIEALRAHLPASARHRIAGLGIAMPYNMESWHRELGVAPEALAGWKGFDLAAALKRRVDLPVFIENDGTAAAAAELFRGHGRTIDSFLSLFIGAAIGGGIVSGGDFQRGMHGNAGDVGLMPVAPSTLASAVQPNARFDVLLSRASVTALLRHLNHHGFTIRTEQELGACLEAAKIPVAEWIEDCADALVGPILGAVRLLDIDTVVIDSDLPGALLDDLIRSTSDHLRRASPESREPPTLMRGSIGPEAAAIGAAILPLHLNFSPNRDVLTGH
jgi:predicted NBD/HSP70 family sugar kinase